MMKEETDQVPCVASKKVPTFRTTRFGRLSENESGVTSIEYALLAALIAMVILSSVTLLGGKVEQMWEGVADKVASAISG